MLICLALAGSSSGGAEDTHVCGDVRREGRGHGEEEMITIGRLVRKTCKTAEFVMR